jgi:uncharacterized protein Yka (UPF0111/DUF47 family)
MQLLPRDVKFYDQLLGQASVAVRAANLLRGVADASGDSVRDVASQLKQLEVGADELKHEVFRRIHKTFITPIDPEDIQAIASALDLVVDSIEAIGYRLCAYGFRTLPPRMGQLAETIYECTTALNGIFETLNEKGLEEQESLIEQCIKVHEVENRSQTLARESVAEVFATETDPIELIKLKDIYEYFEKAGDRCEDVADLIENVLAKAS